MAVSIVWRIRRISVEMTGVHISYGYHTHRHFSLGAQALAAAPLRAAGPAVGLPDGDLAVYAAQLPLPPDVLVVR